MGEKKNKPPCAVCRLVRIYLLVAVPIILIMWIRPEVTRLKGYALTDMFATLIGLMLVVTILWKAYQEFWKPKQDAARKNKKN
jgi:disulfide bond formation protein DsbB